MLILTTVGEAGRAYYYLYDYPAVTSYVVTHACRDAGVAFHLNPLLTVGVNFSVLGTVWLLTAQPGMGEISWLRFTIIIVRIQLCDKLCHFNPGPNGLSAGTREWEVGRHGNLAHS